MNVFSLGRSRRRRAGDRRATPERIAWIEGTQSPSVVTSVTSLMYHLPTKPSVIAQYLKGGPE
jgi:hypothetical protein